MVKSLVVGGCGYIGYEVVKALREIGHEVYVLDTEQSRVTNILKVKAKYVYGTVLDVNKYKDFISSFDLIINLTGGLDDAHLWGLGENFLAQSSATAYLRGGNKTARLIQVSTQYVYSTAEFNKERQKEKPLCDYGIAQLMAEQALGQDENAVVLRFGTVWGKATFTRYDTWGNHFFPIMQKKETVDVENPDNLICMLSMQNAIKAIVWSINGPPSIYNVADKVGLRVDMAQIALGDYVFTPRVYPAGFSIGMDCSRIKKAGFEFDTNVSLGLPEAK